MTGEAAGAAGAAGEQEQAAVSAGRAPRHRVHAFPGRAHRVQPRFDDAEWALIVDAAARSGLTATGYVGAAALAAATGATPPGPSLARDALAELMAARTQVKRFATNVNQAAAQLNSTGEAPGWVEAAVETTARAVQRLDDAAAVLTRRLS